VAIGLGMRLLEQPRSHDNSPVTPGPSFGEREKYSRDRKYEAAFREFSSQPGMAGAALGFCLLDQNGETLFASPLAETALCPASSLKTVTTGAALAILGPDFRFETQIAATAALTPEGVVQGDLILVGGGDPTLSTNDLAELATAAVAAGLKTVAGQLLVDASVFPANPVSDHWMWGDVGNAYGAGAFGLNLDHNRLPLRFEPSAQPGGPAPLGEFPPVPRDTRWINHVTTGAPDSGDQVVVYSEPYGRTITLRGTVPAGESGFTVNGALPDPPALAVEILRQRLEAAGVKFTDGSRSSTADAGARTILARHTSQALPEIIDHLHHVSDNLEAQCLFLTIGRKQDADAATAVRSHYEKEGVAFVGLRLLDGSGLARANVIRPLDLARANYAARRGAHGQRFYESLSTYLNGQVRAKIGSMSGVKTQVGFLRTPDDEELTFAAMGNALPAGRESWTELEKLLEAVRLIE
jgi:D-alanyl-D-alanine carboxypeptidase/D-alanyl-D-alanine-endopeptidase (penicillin-binding protein 4)